MKPRSAVAIVAYLLGLAALSSTMTGTKHPEIDPVVGGADMYPSLPIIDNMAKSNEHTTLVAAARAAGLSETLTHGGPFTMFAPTDAAFAALPAGMVADLLKPENRSRLSQLLAYHMVSGRLDVKALSARIAAAGGSTRLTTLEGEPLTVTGSGRDLSVTDAEGNVARVTIRDVYQKNGVVMVVDRVLLPGRPAPPRPAAISSAQVPANAD